MKKLLLVPLVIGVLTPGNVFAAESVIPLEKTAKEMNKRDAARFEQEQVDRQKEGDSSGAMKEANPTVTPSGGYVYSGMPCKWMRK